MAHLANNNIIIRSVVRKIFQMIPIPLKLQNISVICIIRMFRTVLSPVAVPGVGTDPIGRAIVNSPSDHLHGMASELLSRGVLKHWNKSKI